MAEQFSISKNPVDLVEIFLNSFTNRALNTIENGMNSKNGSSNLKGLLKEFAIESILIYTALLLKKRVVLYHHDLELLLKACVSLSKIMLHRNIPSVLYPWMELNPGDLETIRNKSFFVAGFDDSNISLKTDLYDLFIHLPAAEITVSPHAKDYFIMTKAHKDIALFIGQLSENEALTDDDISIELAGKTEQLISKLKDLATVRTEDGTSMVSFEHLKSLNLSAAKENFLFNLALAENIMML